jgi:hypothetical protein
MAFTEVLERPLLGVDRFRQKGSNGSWLCENASSTVVTGLDHGDAPRRGCFAEFPIFSG